MNLQYNLNVTNNLLGIRNYNLQYKESIAIQMKKKTSDQKYKFYEQKLRQVNSALESNPVDIATLKRIALHNGFMNSSLRAQVWPALLHVTNTDKPFEDYIKPHKDVDQVARDIDRSLWKFIPGKASVRKQKRMELSNIVNSILCKHPELNYYQGFHDVVSIFLLVANTQQDAFEMSERVSLGHLRYALNQTLESTKQILSLLFPLISYVDKEVFDYIQQSGIEPFFALSWIITWFAHELENLDIISRLYDLFIVSHPLMPLYLSAQVVVHMKETLLHKVECDFCEVHSFLSKLQHATLPYEDLIQKAIQLIEEYPPPQLQKDSFVLPKSAHVSMYPYTWMQERQLPRWLLQRQKEDGPQVTLHKRLTKQQLVSRTERRAKRPGSSGYHQGTAGSTSYSVFYQLVFFFLFFLLVITGIIVFTT